MMRYGMQMKGIRKSKFSGLCAFGGGSVSDFCLLDNEYIGFPDFCEI